LKSIINNYIKTLTKHLISNFNFKRKRNELLKAIAGYHRKREVVIHILKKKKKNLKKCISNEKNKQHHYHIFSVWCEQSSPNLCLLLPHNAVSANGHVNISNCEIDLGRPSSGKRWRLGQSQTTNFSKEESW